MNRELFQKIHEVISPEPGTFDPDKFEMEEWEGPHRHCGTTRCVAGWAIHFAAGGVSLWDEDGLQNEAVLDLARRMGAATCLGMYVDFEGLGLKLLELDGDDRALFYADEDEAARFVELAAQGREDEAREVLS